MSVNSTQVFSDFSRQSEQSNIHESGRRFWGAGLFLTGSLGLAAGVIGLVLAAEGITGVTDDRLATWGTVLIAAMFPLLMAAAHCMDKIRDASKAMRLEYCRRHGMKDEECTAVKEDQ